GPAGVACAVALVRCDPSFARRIVVLDRARFPREKPCGGGLTGHIVEALTSLGLELRVPEAPAFSAKVAYGALMRDVSLPRPVRVVRREELDASLLQQARDLGIEVREATPMLGFSFGPRSIDVGTRAGVISTRVLVGADGAGSLLRRYLEPKEA